MLISLHPSFRPQAERSKNPGGLPAFKFVFFTFYFTYKPETKFLVAFFFGPCNFDV